MCQECRGKVINKQIMSPPSRNYRKMWNDTERCSCIGCDHVPCASNGYPWVEQFEWWSWTPPLWKHVGPFLILLFWTSLKFNVEIGPWWYPSEPVKDACNAQSFFRCNYFGRLHILTRGVGQIGSGGKWRYGWHPEGYHNRRSEKELPDTM